MAGGHVWWGGGMYGRGVHGRGGRACMAEGHVWQGHAWQGACVVKMATEVGSTHPTGMHSCLMMC